MTLAMTVEGVRVSRGLGSTREELCTVQSDDAENEDDGQRHDDDGVDLEARRLVSVQLWSNALASSSVHHCSQTAVGVDRARACGLLTQHGARAATSAGGSCAAGSLV